MTTQVRPIRARMNSFIRGLPKAELHVHVEGTLEPTLARALASRNGVPAPAEPTSNARGFPFHDLPSFLALYYARMSVLRTEDDFADLAGAYLRRAHAQNVLHVEMFFDPQAHTSRGVAFETVIRGLRRAVLQGEAELGMSVKLIMCFLRDKSVDSALETLETAARMPWVEWIAGVGLDSDEAGNPPENFSGMFSQAKELGKRVGWKVTCHCDVDQVDSIRHIRTCVREIGVDRLDHGTNIVEDEGLAEEVRRKEIGLTCCPISNSVLNEKDFKGREIVELARRGVKTTVNSDDPAYFGGYVQENFEMIAEKMELSVEEVVGLAKNAFEISWIRSEERERFVGKLDEHARKNAF